MEQTTLPVTDMSDSDSERSVTTALESLEGVATARADHERGEVRVEHDGSTVAEASLAKTIENTGYTVSE